MLTWLSVNLINIVLTAVIVLIAVLIIRGWIRDRKNGKTHCGGNCAGCGLYDSCARQEAKDKGGKA